MTETAEPKKLEIGGTMADGSIYAGLSADGKFQIFAMPNDLSVTMTFNDAARAVEKLNKQTALGHDDWQIPNLDTLRVLHRNQGKGALKGTFNTTVGAAGSGYPGRYWSSTEDRDDLSGVWVVWLSDGFYDWYLKDIIRLSCRPVRLVAASAAPAPR